MSSLDDEFLKFQAELFEVEVQASKEQPAGQQEQQQVRRGGWQRCSVRVDFELERACGSIVGDGVNGAC